MKNINSIGRYAPSPTGDLHLGNLRTALLSWLHSRLQGGRFLLRMEDLDTPRVVKGSAQKIIDDLQWLGLDWDGDIMYQSQRQGAYAQAMETLLAKGLVYPCFCSRKDIQQAVSAPHGKMTVYPRTCAELTQEQIRERSKSKTAAYRLTINQQASDTRFLDGFMGEQKQNLHSECGDFVIKRADGLFAYQLAVVVDDLQQGVTDVLRGADLLDSTARQRYLASILEPESDLQYWHVPLMNEDNGNKMSKRDGSYSISQWRDSGKSAEQLIAYLAESIGLFGDDVQAPKALSLRQLFDGLNYEQFTGILKL